MLIDTHCHLDDEQFDQVRDAVITRALDAGIDFMLTIGTTLESYTQRFCLKRSLPSSRTN